MSNDTPMTDAEHTRLVRISEGPDWIAGKDYVDMRKHSETLERENARLREEVEMLNVRHAAAMLHAQTHADEYNALREDEKGLLQDIQWLTEEAFKRDEELSLANGTIESRDRNIATLQEELAEAKLGSDRLLSTMHAEEEKLRPLIEKAGCDPQHHGADIAIKELLQRAEQAETRALANEKDAAVAKFGATCFAEHRDEMSDLDGGWLHEKALECGLIYGKEVTAEMWDGCGSVHCECEVGDICYFPTDAGKAAISGAKHEG